MAAAAILTMSPMPVYATASAEVGGIGHSHPTVFSARKALREAHAHLPLQPTLQRTTASTPPGLGLDPPTVGGRGYSVAVSGDVAIIGAPGVNDGAGEVLMFGYSNGNWTLKATFQDPRATSLDEYGWSVAISKSSAGVYAAVGADDNNSLPDIVYVYVLSQGVWRQQEALPDPGASTADNFGSSVAISGSTLVVGSMCIDSESGEVHVYERLGQNWDLVATITDPAGGPNDWFGESISISGSNFIVGASDAAYQFTENSQHQWHRKATIADPGSASNNFGWDVSLSGNTAAIGAPGGIKGTLVPSPLGPGMTYVYTLKGIKPSIIGKIRVPTNVKGDQFGYSVATTGAMVLIGMPLYGSAHCGHAFAFKHVGSRWHLQAGYPSKTCSSSSEYGFDVGVSGTMGAFGAPFCNALRGASYLQPLS